MMQSAQINKFIGTICGQVKFKRTHGLLSSELIAHIEDQKSAYIKAGFDEITAEEKAVEQMGDPVTVGEQLNQLHRKKYDWLNIIIWVIAGIIGVSGVIAGVVFFVMMIIIGNSDFVLLASAASMTFILFGLGIAFMIITVWKVTEFQVFGYLLVKDYQRRRKKMNKRRNQ